MIPSHLLSARSPLASILRSPSGVNPRGLSLRLHDIFVTEQTSRGEIHTSAMMSGGFGAVARWAGTFTQHI
jgi:hypothetical protein